MMVVLGTDAHKRSHTVVACDEVGAEIGSLTVAATPQGHLRLVKWSARWEQRRWAIEDCRALSRRLEGDLLAAGERVVRVPRNSWPAPAVRRALEASRTRSTRWRWPEPRCANRTCR